MPINFSDRTSRDHGYHVYGDATVRISYGEQGLINPCLSERAFNARSNLVNRNNVEKADVF